MSVVSLGAVAYLNARPLVYGLESNPAFALRFDVPSRCAALLHEGSIAAEGTPESVLLHPTCASAFGVRITAHRASDRILYAFREVPPINGTHRGA
jgi:hypothetical protein